MLNLKKALEHFISTIHSSKLPQISEIISDLKDGSSCRRIVISAEPNYLQIQQA